MLDLMSFQSGTHHELGSFPDLQRGPNCCLNLQCVIGFTFSCRSRRVMLLNAASNVTLIVLQETSLEELVFEMRHR